MHPPATHHASAARAVNRQLPPEPEVPLGTCACIERDERDEERARPDLLANGRIPCVTAPEARADRTTPRSLRRGERQRFFERRACPRKRRRNTAHGPVGVEMIISRPSFLCPHHDPRRSPEPTRSLAKSPCCCGRSGPNAEPPRPLILLRTAWRKLTAVRRRAPSHTVPPQPIARTKTPLSRGSLSPAARGQRWPKRSTEAWWR
jgi:hypothetical protein